MLTLLKILLSITLVLYGDSTKADQLRITVTIPALDVDPYHRPYLAIWIEDKHRQGVTTVALWQEKTDWLKDLRQWWRKLGRGEREAYEAVTGATRKPGNYRIDWNDESFSAGLAAGEYYLCVEAAREAGGRDFLRQKILWGSDHAQLYDIKGKLELGDIQIHLTP